MAAAEGQAVPEITVGKESPGRTHGSRILTEWKRERVARQLAPIRQTRKFEAAAINRLTSSWLTSTASIDRELRGDLDKLRARSRDMCRNNEYAKKFLRMVRTNVVGPHGFTLQLQVLNSDGSADKLANDAIEAAFKKWGRKGICEVSGQYSFADVQRVLIGAAARDGEFLVRKVRGEAAGNVFGFALQILDIDRLDTRLNIAPAGNRNAVVMGVEMDAYRRPVAYWIFKSHPNGFHGSARERERVPASDIIHAFLPDELEQPRGIPWMHAAMRRLHDLGGYREAAIIAARIGAAQMGVITSPEGTADAIKDGEDAEGVPEIEAEPGTFPVLPEGYDMTPFNPTYPHQQYEMFNKACLRGIGSGFGVSYHGLANDLEGVSFSSIRSGVLEERDEWMVLQNWFDSSLMAPVTDAMLEMSILSGAVIQAGGSALPVAKLDKFLVYSWQGRRWPWVDPKKDMEASLLAINNGLSSPQRVAAAMGMDIEDVLNELKKFQEMLETKGVVLGTDTSPPNEDVKTINEKRAELGLDDIDGGDAIFMPSSEIPALEKTP